ncbi:unnamed protein product [Linum trigynum]|uniref:Uncharacterized protein n=1 Tax=Linum trigynum TaxID=586398 RepID=A0AAV2GRI7_9ROSI
MTMMIEHCNTICRLLGVVRRRPITVNHRGDYMAVGSAIQDCSELKQREGAGSGSIHDKPESREHKGLKCPQKPQERRPTSMSLTCRNTKPKRVPRTGTPTSSTTQSINNNPHPHCKSTQKKNSDLIETWTIRHDNRKRHRHPH